MSLWENRCDCNPYKVNKSSIKRNKHHCSNNGSKCKKHHCDNCCKCKKTCKEGLSELLFSLGEIESSLASAIQAESDLIRNGNLTTEQRIKSIEKLENIIKLAIKKEIIMELLLEDAIKGCKAKQDKD